MLDFLGSLQGGLLSGCCWVPTRCQLPTTPHSLSIQLAASGKAHAVSEGHGPREGMTPWPGRDQLPYDPR